MRFLNNHPGLLIHAVQKMLAHGISAYSVLLGEMHGRNPTRRNRNIGTARSGHGQNNRLTIPEVGHGGHVFWERIDGASEISRVVSGRVLRFFIQPTRADCVYACTVDDITRLMSYVPSSDWEGLETVVLRQPRRKEQILASVWGRLSYAADLVNRHGDVLYRGPAIIIEAVKPTAPLKFGKSLSLDDMAELERLKWDGHKLRPNDSNHTLEPTLESCRATQLYRTIPHELGHWVDFLEKVEHPSVRFGADEEIAGYGKLLDRYHSRPNSEKERFAHAYAEQLRRHLIASRAIPFDRQLDCEQMTQDRLRLQDFHRP
jgi:hypothetical protein